MSEKLIRIGKISKVEYDTGMAEVTYPDMDNSVTALFPILNLNEEYKMPAVGEEVLVLHLSNGSASGLILGPYWNIENTPAVSGENTFRKEFSKTQGTAYIQYKDGTVELRGPAIRFVCSSGAFTAAQVLNLFTRVSSLEERCTALEKRCDALEERCTASEATAEAMEARLAAVEAKV